MKVAVVAQTTTVQTGEVEKLFSGEDLIGFQEIVRKVPISEETVRYAVKIAGASWPGRPEAPDFINELVNWGAGLRAGQNLVLGAKARALLEGRAHATKEDVTALAGPVLRHRILVNYRAEAEGASVDSIVERLVEHVGKAGTATA